VVGDLAKKAGYLNDTNQFDDGYEDIKQLEGEIVEFAYRVRKSHIDTELSQRIEQLLETIRNATYAAKEIKDIREDLSYIRQSDNLFIFNIYQSLIIQVTQFYAQASDLFNPHNEAVLLENFTLLKHQEQKHKERVTREIYEDSRQQKLTEQDLSTLLNMLAEVSLSHTLLLRAIQSYLFKTESSRVLASVA
jgi:phosphate:Na+ symporter